MVTMGTYNDKDTDIHVYTNGDIRIDISMNSVTSPPLPLGGCSCVP